MNPTHRSEAPDRRVAPSAGSGRVRSGPGASARAGGLRLGRWRAPLLVALAAFASALLCGWLAHALIERGTRDTLQAGLASLRDAQAARLLDRLAEQRRVTAALARLPAASELVSPMPEPPADATPAPTPPSQARAALERAFAQIGSHAGLESLVVADAAQGRVLIALSETIGEGESLSAGSLASSGIGRAFARGLARDRAAGGALVADTSAGGQALFLAEPIASAPFAAALPDPTGVLVARIDPARLRALLADGIHDGPPGAVPTTSVVIGRPTDDLDAMLLSLTQGERIGVRAITRSDGTPQVAAFRRIAFEGMPITVAVSSPVPPAVSSGLVSRLVIGSALIALVLGALAWRRDASTDEGWRMKREVAQVLRAVRQGDWSARTRLSGANDPGGFGETLDRILDDRSRVASQAARESSGLNDSVVRIMEAVGRIATTRDLRLRVPVTEDVTGAISDALNMLTEETGRAFGRISRVAQEVARATLAVRGQSETATRAAGREQREVEQAARELAMAARALTAVAEQASEVDQVAERAVVATAGVARTLEKTVDGVDMARDMIRQTEKRVKRLGERSQEIGQVVDIIQSIAERTGILALNASLQAAAAGEAGRNFAVVADEVKRLAQSAGQATEQIARLVAAIQSETAETLAATNQAIARVVAISEMAAETGRSLVQTQSETRALAEEVRDIALTTGEQANASAELQKRARVIKEASDETARQLAGQVAETNRLVDCARALLEEVSAFKTEDRG